MKMVNYVPVDTTTLTCLNISLDQLLNLANPSTNLLYFS